MLLVKICRNLADTPQDVIGLSEKQKKQFIFVFRDLDRSFNHLKAFSTYDPQILKDNHFHKKNMKIMQRFIKMFWQN